MSYRSFALVTATLASMHVAGADAQSVYVAPGGVYIAGGPVYVTPAPNVAPYVAPGAYGYGLPAVPPPPAVVAPTAYYGPGGGYYSPPIVAYGAEIAPRPPFPVPHYGNARCYGRCY